MNENLSPRKMLSEFYREVAVLYAVFGPLEMIATNQPLTIGWFLITFGIVIGALGYGMYLGGTGE